MALTINQPNYNGESFASSSTSQLPLQQQQQQQQQKELILETLEPQTLPPPQKEKQQKSPSHHYDHPPFPHPISNTLSDSRRSDKNSTTTTSSSSSSSGSGVLLLTKEDPEDDSDLTMDDDDDDNSSDGQEDEDKVDKELTFVPTSNSTMETVKKVEDVCLACDGLCRCGGAKGATVYVPSILNGSNSSTSRVGSSSGLKVKITMSSMNPSSSSTVTSTSTSTSRINSTTRSSHNHHHHHNHHIQHQPQPSFFKTSTNHNTIIISDDEDENYSPRHSHNKKFKIGGGNSSANGSLNGGSLAGSRASTPTGSINSSTTSNTKKSKTKSTKITNKKERPISGTFDVFSNKEASYSHHSSASSSTSNHSHHSTTSTTSTNRKSTKPLPTPSRSSLRQVLAMSSKDILPPSPPLPSIMNVFKSPSSLSQSKPKYDQEVSDFDLDGVENLSSSSSSSGSSGSSESSESEGELGSVAQKRGGRIEKAEERALRREFEVGLGESTESDESDEGMSDLGIDEWDELRIMKTREEKGKGLAGTKSNGTSSRRRGEEDEEDDEVGFTDLPLSGGRGVVTWSDYDSIGQEDDQEEEDEEDEDEEHDELARRQGEERDFDEAGEFENELEELFALSEAVVGPVREGEYGEMWLEEISNLGDDESGSNGEFSDEELEEEEENIEGEEEDGDETTVVVMDRWGVNYSRRSTRRLSQSGSSDNNNSAASDSDDYDDDDLMAAFDDDEDGGDTTDSLDSDDHVGLVRFGIEVESDTEASSSSDEMMSFNYRGFAPGTASLADVQAPTSADLASLPQYLFFNPNNHNNLTVPEIDDDSTNTAAGSDNNTTATSTLTSTGNKLLDSVNRSLSKGKGRASRMENLKEEEEDLGKVVPRSPAMGIFAPKDSGGRSKDVSVMIDESDTIAASPFSKAKKGKKRGRDLLDTTPSRRTRADSKVSTASGRSITDDSLSGEIREPASPDLASTTFDLDLHDVLHPSILQRGPTSISASSDEDSEGPLGTRKRKRLSEVVPVATGLSDLSRWNRIPISAFRSSTMASSFQPETQYSNSTAEEATIAYSSRRKSGSLHLPLSTNPALRGTHSTTISHTLSSPQTTSDMTKKAIERRMLCSPLLGPRDSSNIVASASPKSRKVKRKEKKAQFTSSPQVLNHNMMPSSVDSSSSRIVESYLSALPPHPNNSSSPFLSASNYLPSLHSHSPLFRSSATVHSNFE